MARVSGCQTSLLDAGGVQLADYELLDDLGGPIGVLEVESATLRRLNGILRWRRCLISQVSAAGASAYRVTCSNERCNEVQGNAHKDQTNAPGT